MANAEQVGANRHVASNEGASTRRYVLSSVISARANSGGGGLSLVGGELEGSRELGGRLGIREGVRTRLRNDHHVGRRPDVATAGAKNLAEDPLDAATDHRVSDPLAHRDAEAGGRARGRPAEEPPAPPVAAAPRPLCGK